MSAQSCPTLCDPMDCSPSVICLWDFPGKNTGLDCHFLLQGIFPTQGSKPDLPHCRQILYYLSHQGRPNYLPEAPSLNAILLEVRISPYELGVGTVSSKYLLNKIWTRFEILFILRPNFSLVMNLGNHTTYVLSKHSDGQALDRHPPSKRAKHGTSQVVQ